MGIASSVVFFRSGFWGGICLVSKVGGWCLGAWRGVCLVTCEVIDGDFFLGGHFAGWTAFDLPNAIVSGLGGWWWREVVEVGISRSARLNEADRDGASSIAKGHLRLWSLGSCLLPSNWLVVGNCECRQGSDALPCLCLAELQAGLRDDSSRASEERRQTPPSPP